MIQRRTLLSGTALGLALLGALTLAGVLGKRHEPPRAAPPPVLESDARIASQPQLQQALLTPADLPRPFVAASAAKATVRRLPEPERCGALLDPSSLVREASARALPRPEPTDQASTRLDGPTRLVQLLTTFAGDGAEVTLRELRDLGSQCREFPATLEDGTPVRVRVEERESVRPDTYTLRLTMTGGGRTTAGHLTLSRVGRVLTVLEQLGPVDAVSALDPVKLVDLTLGRLTR